MKTTRPFRMGALLLALPLAACATPASSPPAQPPASGSAAYAPVDARAALLAQVMRGRQLVISHDCGACHGGGSNPDANKWLSGGPFAPLDGFSVNAPNLTPDPRTGIGRYTDRQIFNAIRFGLRPESTPDVVITSNLPGVGNHPADPKYLAPMMPWTAWRFMSDDELWDIIAYLRHAVQPVENEVPPSQVAPDGWASRVKVSANPYPAPPFPTDREELLDASRRADVLRGRALVLSLGCGDCHGGRSNPAAHGWLAGVLPEAERVDAGAFEQPFDIGPFKTIGRNLTPDNVTGLGRFSERQLFNALRFGLRPGETPDVEITSATPGAGNHPLHPKYLAPPMPWPAWRHLSDAQLRDIVAYLKFGLKPVRNRVEPSDGPPDFWAGEYTPEKIGTYPAASYPTKNERRP